MPGRRDEFLSEEDLDLRNLSWEELLAWWDLWLAQAQATNDLDAHLYSHGVFRQDPSRPGPPPPRDQFL
jgi:hypothetical protein